MLKTSVKSLHPEPLPVFGEGVDPGKVTRLARIFVAAALAHVALLALLAWSERQGGPGGGATAAVEIPVELETAEGPDNRTEMQQGPTQARAPTAVEPRAEAEAQTPAAARRADERPPETEAGKIVERPRESELPQAARTRGAETKTPAHEETNPFGGLAEVPKPAPVEPTPTFLSPQAMAPPARPRPPQDPTNDNYRAKILGKVAANMIDPERPRPKALAIVGFRIDAQGALEAVWLARPTGSAELDAEAVAMVRRSAPFEPPPANADRNFGAAIAFGDE